MVNIQQINDYLNKIPEKIKKAPMDEKIAYFSIFLGILLIIIWLFQKLVF